MSSYERKRKFGRIVDDSMRVLEQKGGGILVAGIWTWFVASTFIAEATTRRTGGNMFDRPVPTYGGIAAGIVILVAYSWQWKRVNHYPISEAIEGYGVFAILSGTVTFLIAAAVVAMFFLTIASFVISAIVCTIFLFAMAAALFKNL